MNRVIIACAILSLTAAAVIPEEAQAQIVKYESTNDGAGNYRFSYETSNGITREESGHLVNIGKEDEHMRVDGFYSYKDVNGKEVVVRYIADENGFQVNPDLVPESGYTDNSLPAGVVATLLG